MSFEQSGGADRREVTVRRAPKFLTFMVIGLLAGLVAAGLVTFLSPEDPYYTRGAVLGFFSMVLGVPGLGLGAAVALLFDAISVRRARRSLAVAIDSSADPGRP